MTQTTPLDSDHAARSSSTPGLQPFLAAETVVLRAPAQAWSAADGSMGAATIHGIYLGDTRLVARQALTVDGLTPEHVATVPLGASAFRVESLLRGLDDAGADPDVRLSSLRDVTTTGVHERHTVTSRLDRELTVTVAVTLRPDASPMDHVKAGLVGEAARDVTVSGDGTRASWLAGAVEVALETRGGAVRSTPAGLVVEWVAVVPARGAVTVGHDLVATAPDAVVRGVRSPHRWAELDPAPRDDRLARWIERARDDLAALRLTTTDAPDDVFYAAGAPWFFTLFGRDSLWAARFTLPVDLTGLDPRSVPNHEMKPGMRRNDACSIVVMFG